LNNKPKYHLFKNTSYALDGLKHALKTESSFRLELLAGVIIIPAIFLMNFSIEAKLILLVTALLVPIVELLNSAIENAVDLVTFEKHPLAKTAKDIGATAVFFSILLHIVCWVVVLI
jgi:diacylglycerol kinase (ATP)